MSSATAPIKLACEDFVVFSQDTVMSSSPGIKQQKSLLLSTAWNRGAGVREWPGKNEVQEVSTHNHEQHDL